MSKLYKVSYIDLFNKEGKVTTTIASEDGLNNLMDEPYVDVLAYKEAMEGEIQNET